MTLERDVLSHVARERRDSLLQVGANKKQHRIIEERHCNSFCTKERWCPVKDNRSSSYRLSPSGKLFSCQRTFLVSLSPKNTPEVDKHVYFSRLSYESCTRTLDILWYLGRITTCFLLPRKRGKVFRLSLALRLARRGYRICISSYKSLSPQPFALDSPFTGPLINRDAVCPAKRGM